VGLIVSLTLNYLYMITSTYNIETNNITFTSDEFTDHSLELWYKDYEGDKKIGSYTTNPISFELTESKVYRVYAKLIANGLVVGESEVVNYLFIKELKKNLQDLIIKSLAYEKLIINYVELKKIYIKIQSEFNKSNFLTATEYIKKFKDEYNKIK
jgi:hypothetical protein